MNKAVKAGFCRKLKTTWPWLFLLVVVILASRPLFARGFFSMHDDVQVMRLYQMERCFQDGQIPCRWVPDMGAGYGHPLYNYHPVFAYYLGMVFRLFGISFVNITKILFFLTYLLSGLFMYLLVKEFFGRVAGLVGGAFFVLTPYHAVDVYVRGAMTESWGVVFFPLILWSLYRYLQERKPIFFFTSVFALAGLFLSHNIMTLVFTPVAVIWAGYWFLREKSRRSWRQVFSLAGIFIWAFGLAAFFLLPAFLEKSLVKIETLTSDYYDFRHHFVAWRQLLLDRSWGYGPSRPGPEDGMSFQLGWPHWWLFLAAVAVFGYLFFKKKRREVGLESLGFFLVLFLAAAAMTHARSVFVWQALPLISFVQFPWRFLALAMFASAFAAGGLVGLLKGKKQVGLAAGLVVLLVVLNVGFSRAGEQYPEMNDQRKLSGEEWRIQSMATLMDYIPNQIKVAPTELAPDQPWVVASEAKLSEFRRRSNFWRLTIEVAGDEPALIEVPIFDFPVWQVLIDQQEVDHQFNEATGVIQFMVPAGKHTVVGWLKNTPLRQVANGLTLVSFAGLILAIVLVRQRGKDEDAQKNH